MKKTPIVTQWSGIEKLCLYVSAVNWAVNVRKSSAGLLQYESVPRCTFKRIALPKIFQPTICWRCLAWNRFGVLIGFSVRFRCVISISTALANSTSSYSHNRKSKAWCKYMDLDKCAALLIDETHFDIHVDSSVPQMHLRQFQCRPANSINNDQNNTFMYKKNNTLQIYVEVFPLDATIWSTKCQFFVVHSHGELNLVLWRNALRFISINNMLKIDKVRTVTTRSKHLKFGRVDNFWYPRWINRPLCWLKLYRNDSVWNSVGRPTSRSCSHWLPVDVIARNRPRQMFSHRIFSNN